MDIREKLNQLQVAYLNEDSPVEMITQIKREIADAWDAMLDAMEERLPQAEARIAEMEKELERQRWRYPYKGELPEKLAEVIVSIPALRIALYNGEKFVLMGFGEGHDPKRIYKWRHID